MTAVLGAGNTEVLNDIIDPLCRQNSVVVYKANPVLCLSSTVKQLILQPLIERGFVSFVFGGVEQGQAILHHPKVDRVLITGCHHTFDKIVWGSLDKTDPSVEPVVKKPFTAELGAVNPYIIVPGRSAWSASDIDFQAESLIGYKLLNSGHVCAAPQVLVTCKAWPQRQEFLAAVRSKLRVVPPTKCFYPGSEQKYRRHVGSMGSGALCGEPPAPGQSCPVVPLAFEEGLEPPISGKAPIALQEEAFCPVLYEVAVDTPTSFDEFLPAAVDMCHRSCWGNLTCMIIVDDATKAESQQKLDEVLDSMRFGTIGVNFPASAANAFPVLPWGAFPGNELRDVKSGIGYVGNFCCYQGVEKSIMVNRFRNLHAMRVAKTEAEMRCARREARRVAAVFGRTSMWRIVKLALVKFFGI